MKLTLSHQSGPYALRKPKFYALGLLAVALVFSLACGQSGDAPAAPAVVELTPPPPVNTVAPAAVAEEPAAAETQSQPAAPAAPAASQTTPEPAAPAPAAQQLTVEQVAAAHDQIMSNLYVQTVPSVVGLRVIQPVTVGVNVPQGMPNDLFSRASGSGFVWDDEGHVVTNMHVVESAERIVVVLSDGSQTNAEIVGQDPDSDLAVIKITDDSVRPPPITLGDSDAISPGQLAVAIGDPFSARFLHDFRCDQRPGTHHQPFRKQLCHPASNTA